MGQWKAWSTRRLRERGWVGAEQPVWTRHGSTRYLWRGCNVESALAYVEVGQDAMRFEDSQGS